MANEFTLDDLNATLEKKYSPFVFTAGREKFVLQQILRLPKDKRDVVKAQLQVLEENKGDLDEDQMLVVLKAVVGNALEGDKVDRLFDILENDLVKVTVLVEQWVGNTQAGEA